MSENGELYPNAPIFYTYEDYCKFSDEHRREIIGGVAHLMSPSSNIIEHQTVSVNLIYKFKEYLKDKKYQILHAPFDVRLPKEGETKNTASNVVQPDIFIVCDKDKLDKRSCFGSPDLIIEILAPTTRKRDLTEKFDLYQQNGVLEYWVVDAFHQTIDRFSFDKNTGKYKSAEYFDRNDTISPSIFPYLAIKLEDVFPLIEYDE